MTLSIVLGIIGITGQLLMARGHRLAGWSLSLAAQPLWTAFAVLTGQYGLLLLSAGYAVAAVLNVRRALAEHRAAAASGGGPMGNTTGRTHHQ